MLQKETLKFLKELKKNNNKAWFDLHRKDHEQAKQDLTGMVAKLIAEVAKFDPPIGALQPRDCLFRINRDVRFSKDKSPYKTNMAAYFNKGGKKSNGAGYYLHIEPGKCMAAGGMWMPLPADLAKIRQEIDYGFADWKKITGSANFKKYFPEGVIADSSLSRPPKGYDEQNPAIIFLKMKSFIVSRPFGDTEIMDKAFVTTVAQTFRAMKPLIDFLNQAID